MQITDDVKIYCPNARNHKEVFIDNADFELVRIGPNQLVFSRVENEPIAVDDKTYLDYYYALLRREGKTDTDIVYLLTELKLFNDEERNYIILHESPLEYKIENKPSNKFEEELYVKFIQGDPIDSKFNYCDFIHNLSIQSDMFDGTEEIYIKKYLSGKLVTIRIRKPKPKQKRKTNKQY